MSLRASMTCWLAPVVLFCLMATGCYSSSGTLRVESYVSQVDEARLKQHLNELTRHGPRPETDRAAIARCLLYLDDQLRSFGYEPTLELFHSKQLPQVNADSDIQSAHANLMVEIRGSKTPNRVIEVGAHYDTVAHAPGADDNTSAVAGLLEIARVCSTLEFDMTVRFCFFAYEEGGLFGSRHHVAQMTDEQRDAHEGIIVLEMIGYTSREEGSQRTPARIPLVVWPPTVGDFIAVVGNYSSGEIGNHFERAAARYVDDLHVYSLNRIGGFFGDAARSDHFPYWRAGLRGVMITDTADFRNPHYHQSSDTIETLDFEFMRQVTEATVATLLEWPGAWREPRSSEGVSSSR